jgi:hypothetical protein
MLLACFLHYESAEGGGIFMQNKQQNKQQQITFNSEKLSSGFDFFLWLILNHLINRITKKYLGNRFFNAQLEYKAPF